MSVSLKHKKLIREYIKYIRLTKLSEARDDSFAEYEVKKDKVIATLKKQKATAFTKLAEEWSKFEKLEIELADKKRKLNVELQAAKEMEDTLKDKIREKVTTIFDESEQAMSLAVHCLGSSFTLSKLTTENEPSVVAKSGDLINTDYKKVVDMLLEQNKDLQETVSLLIKQCSTIAVEDIIKPGSKRRLKVDVGESRINEGLWDRITSAFNFLTTKIKSGLSKIFSRKEKIDQILIKLQR